MQRRRRFQPIERTAERARLARPCDPGQLLGAFELGRRDRRLRRVDHAALDQHLDVPRRAVSPPRDQSRRAIGHSFSRPPPRDVPPRPNRSPPRDRARRATQTTQTDGPAAFFPRASAPLLGERGALPFSPILPRHRSSSSRAWPPRRVDGGWRRTSAPRTGERGGGGGGGSARRRTVSRALGSGRATGGARGRAGRGRGRSRTSSFRSAPRRPARMQEGKRTCAQCN